jgi:hypothetical protein
MIKPLFYYSLIKNLSFIIDDIYDDMLKFKLKIINNIRKTLT